MTPLERRFRHAPPRLTAGQLGRALGVCAVVLAVLGWAWLIAVAR